MMSGHAMLPLITSGLLACLCALLLVPVSRRLAVRLGAVAAPRRDRWHATSTPILGGVAIAVTVLGLHAALIGVHDERMLLAGVACLFLLGLADDLWSLTPVTRVVCEVIVASLVAFAGHRLGWVTSLTLDTLLTVLWIVGITNAFNLLDNMDGLSAGLAVIAGLAALSTVLLDGGVTPTAVHLALLVGATLGFLAFNVAPASVFMGDSGSLFLGGNLAMLTLGGHHAGPGSPSVLSTITIPLLIVLVPIVDTALVTISRTLAGRKAWHGGRDHTSHRLVAVGLSERSAVGVLWSLAAIGSGLAIALRQLQHPGVTLAVGAFAVGMLAFAVYLAHVRVYREDELPRVPQAHLTIVRGRAAYLRRSAEVVVDVCLVAVAFYLSYRLRYDAPTFQQVFPSFLRALPLVIAVQIASLLASGAYRTEWRGFRMTHGVRLALGIVVGAVAQVTVLRVIGEPTLATVPAPIIGIDTAVALVLVTGARVGVRLLGELAARRQGAALRVVVYANGDLTAIAADVRAAGLPVPRLLGCVTDDPGTRGETALGPALPGGYAALRTLVETASVDVVLVCGLVDAARLAELTTACALRGIDLQHRPVRPASASAAS